MGMELTGKEKKELIHHGSNPVREEKIMMGQYIGFQRENKLQGLL